jgi:hypothetical protein
LVSLCLQKFFWTLYCWEQFIWWFFIRQLLHYMQISFMDWLLVSGASSCCSFSEWVKHLRFRVWDWQISAGVVLFKGLFRWAELECCLTRGSKPNPLHGRQDTYGCSVLVIPVMMIIGTGLGETGVGSNTGCHLDNSDNVIWFTRIVKQRRAQVRYWNKLLEYYIYI